MRQRISNILVVCAILITSVSAFAAPVVINATMPAVQYDPSKIGQTITIPILVSDITGMGILGFNFTLTYDTTVVKYIGYDDAGTVSAGITQIGNNDIANSRLMWAAAGMAPLSGKDTLVRLQFKLVGIGNTALNFPIFKFNDVIDAVVTAGRIKIGNTKPTMSAILPVNKMEKDTVAFTVSGIDPDNDSLTYSATSAPAGATLNAKTGKFFWIPPYGSKGTYTVQIKCTDVGGLTDVTTASITIAKKNVRPYIAAVTNKTVAERDTLAFTIAASDSNADPLIYKMSGAPAASKFDSTKGAFSWVPDTGKAAVYPVTVIVRDTDGATDTTKFTMTVTKKNFIPVVQKISPKSVIENDTLAFTVTGTDLYGEKITYSAKNIPSGATIDSASGAFVWVPGIGTAGSYAVTFKASDPGGLFDTTTVSVIVTAKNRKPALVSKSPTDTIKYLVNKAVTFKASVKDPDNDTLKYTWKLNGVVVKAAGTDSTYTTQFSVVGVYDLRVVFEDKGGLKDSTKWAVNIVLTGVKDVAGAVPTAFELGQNYPNPFNPSTSVSFALPSASPVTFEVYTILGTKVRTLISGQTMSAAYHTVVWNGKDDNGTQLSSGMYLYRIAAGSYTSTRKMMMLK